MRSPEFTVLTVTLTGDGAVSIGDPERRSLADRVAEFTAAERTAELTIDMPVAQDPAGNPIVRGTSVLGALRAHLAQYELDGAHALRLTSIDSRDPGELSTRPSTLADLVCGAEPEERDAKGKPVRRPSAFRLLAAAFTGTKSDGHPRVAVNRSTGAAEAKKLYRRAEAVDGVLELIIQIDHAVLRLAAEQLGVSAKPISIGKDVARALGEWQARMGGLAGTGRGAMSVGAVWGRVEEGVSLEALFGSTSTLAYMTRGLSLWADDSPFASCVPIPDGEAPWSMRLRLRAVDPLVVSPRNVSDEGHDNVSESADTIHGSTWRGILRSRCEFILRTCGVEVCESASATCQADPVCPTCELFGWTATVPTAADGRTSGARGLIRFLDSPISGPKPTPGVQVDSPKLPIHHAPIDRFTGGAATGGSIAGAGGKLYSYRAWPPGSRTVLDIAQLDMKRPVPVWASSLLTLAVRDLADGYVGVGHATTRGYGTLTLSDGASLPRIPGDWLEQLGRR